jgi:hypothetical protein
VSGAGAVPSVPKRKKFPIPIKKEKPLDSQERIYPVVI